MQQKKINSNSELNGIVARTSSTAASTATSAATSSDLIASLVGRYAELQDGFMDKDDTDGQSVFSYLYKCILCTKALNRDGSSRSFLGLEL